MPRDFASHSLNIFSLTRVLVHQSLCVLNILNVYVKFFFVFLNSLKVLFM